MDCRVKLPLPGALLRWLLRFPMGICFRVTALARHSMLCGFQRSGTSDFYMSRSCCIIRLRSIATPTRVLHYHLHPSNGAPATSAAAAKVAGSASNSCYRPPNPSMKLKHIKLLASHDQFVPHLSKKGWPSAIESPLRSPIRELSSGRSTAGAPGHTDK